MKTWLQKHVNGALVPALYAGGLVLLLVVQLAGFVQNRVAYANGTLQTAQLTLEDFDLVGAEQWDDDTLYCLTGDPQLLLKDTQRRVDTVTFTGNYSLAPQMVNAFWAEPGQDYSVRNMAYAQGGQETAALFLLPASGGQSLRIDPGAVAGNVITITSITINEKRPLAAFLRPSAGAVALWAVVPGLLGCVLTALRGAGLWPKAKNRTQRPKAGAAHG